MYLPVKGHQDHSWFRGTLGHMEGIFVKLFAKKNYRKKFPKMGAKCPNVPQRGNSKKLENVKKKWTCPLEELEFEMLYYQSLGLMENRRTHEFF